MKKKIEKKAVFLDRDGVINYDFGYVHKISDFKWKKKVFEAIKYLNKKNFLVIIITNQSGIGRGYYTYKDVTKLHLWMKKKLSERGAIINDIFFAPYYKYSKKKYFSKDRLMRKPNVGMLSLAKNKWSIDFSKSFIVGDSISDKKLAKNAKIKFLRVTNKTNLLDLVKININ